MKDQALHLCPAQGLNHTTDPVMYQPCTTDLHEAVSDEPLAATRSRPTIPSRSRSPTCCCASSACCPTGTDRASAGEPARGIGVRLRPTQGSGHCLRGRSQLPRRAPARLPGMVAEPWVFFAVTAMFPDYRIIPVPIIATGRTYMVSWPRRVHRKRRLAGVEMHAPADGVSQRPTCASAGRGAYRFGAPLPCREAWAADAGHEDRP